MIKWFWILMFIKLNPRRFLPVQNGVICVTPKLGPWERRSSAVSDGMKRPKLELWLEIPSVGRTNWSDVYSILIFDWQTQHVCAFWCLYACCHTSSKVFPKKYTNILSFPNLYSLWFNSLEEEETVQTDADFWSCHSRNKGFRVPIFL